MKTALAILALLMLVATSFGRDEIPPASITITINTLGPDAASLRHNGTFTLTGVNNKNSVGDPWFYSWQDRPENPTAMWCVRITSNDHIEVGAGSGQFAVGNWTTDGNIMTVTSVPPCKPFTQTVFIKANP